MVTGFGKFCRKLRIDNSEILSDMARRLGVSSAFLSKVENGLKKPPKNWEEKIGELYNLDSEAKEKLKEVFFEALNYDSLDMTSFSEDNRSMLLSFARKLNVMDENKKQQLKKIFESDGGSTD